MTLIALPLADYPFPTNGLEIQMQFIPSILSGKSKLLHILDSIKGRED